MQSRHGTGFDINTPLAVLACAGSKAIGISDGSDPVGSSIFMILVVLIFYVANKVSKSSDGLLFCLVDNRPQPGACQYNPIMTDTFTSPTRQNAKCSKHILSVFLIGRTEVSRGPQLNAMN